MSVELRTYRVTRNGNLIALVQAIDALSAVVMVQLIMPESVLRATEVLFDENDTSFICTVQNCSNPACYFIIDSIPRELLCTDCHENIIFRGTRLQIEPIE